MNDILGRLDARVSASKRLIEAVALHHKASHHPPGSDEAHQLWGRLQGTFDLLALDELNWPLGIVDVTPLVDLRLVTFYEQTRDEHLTLWEGPSPWLDDYLAA